MLLGVAFLLAASGLTWFAFALERHWRQIFETAPLAPSTSRRLRLAGSAALVGSLLACLRTDHATMASLVFVMLLAAAAVLVAMLLAWRPHWLRPLLVFARRGSRAA